MPQELLACAQHLPEAENVTIAHVGPASRASDMACEAHGAAKPVEKDNADDADWEEAGTTTHTAESPTEAEHETMKFETNTAEDVIAVDHSNDPGVLETFAAFQTKLQAVNAAAARVMAAGQQHSSQSEVSVAKPDAGVEKPDDRTAVNAACAIAARREECRTLVLETQELAKKLNAPELKKMSQKFAETNQACISTSGSPLSMLNPDTWPKCFLDFFYGDAVPNMELRGKEGNNTVHVDFNELFTWLQDREELEYTLPSDTEKPYKARTTSRFDTPEFTAIFGSVKRHVLILKGVHTVFRRQGYEADLKIIATAKAADCVEILCERPRDKPTSASKSGRQRGLDVLAYAPDVPENLRKAVRQVLFSTVKVPFTDGYRRNLRHEGHNLNAVHGPLKIFMTANFADVYSPVLLSMILADGDGNPVAEPATMPWPDSLTKQCPEMCTLQSMHRLVAQCPRTQAKFFLLMDDLVDRYLLGIGNSNVGCHKSQTWRNQQVEDDFCSSGEPGLAGFAVAEMEPFEAQKRGFTHGHRKVYGVPEVLGPEMLRQFQTFGAEKPDESTISTLFQKIAEALVACASTLQYEAATLSARQMRQEVPLEKFTQRQQDLSRLDGGEEIDGTQRDTLQPTPDEPLGHVVAEENNALLESRPTRNTYRDVPLTGCHNSLLPLYRQPHLAFHDFPMLDEFGCNQDPTGGEAVLESLPVSLPWECEGCGEVKWPTSPEGHALNTEDFKSDAQRYALCHARDTRALHCHNHDHNCSFTCIKYAKNTAKTLAESHLNQATNIVCRFFFYVCLVFNVLVDGVEKVKRIRRRGKARVFEPFVASTNEHNELGRVQVERHTPFRGATTDFGQSACRCNLDFQFMPRAPVLQSLDETPVNVTTGKRTLSYDKAEAFYAIRMQLPDSQALRQAAHSMLAMWQAAHATDYYITKYGTKALEQLQNLIAQFALGLRRLEQDEEREQSTCDPSVLENPTSYKQRARRVTLRLAMAANRATWTSCCEMALFIRSGARYTSRKRFLFKYVGSSPNPQIV